MKTKRERRGMPLLARLGALLMAALMLSALLVLNPMQAQAATTGTLTVGKTVENGGGGEVYGYDLELWRDVNQLNFPVTIHWRGDAGNEANRPLSPGVPVTLKRNGAAVARGNVPVNATANTHRYTFPTQPREDGNGDVYTYTLEAGGVANYTLARSGPNEFTYTYNPSAPTTATITVRHVAQGTGDVLNQQVYTVAPGGYGPYGEQSFPDYRYRGLAAGSSPEQGTVNAGESLTVTHEYEGQGSIVINYLDATDFSLVAASETHTVAAGHYGPYTAPQISGYTFARWDNDPPSGTIDTGETRTINFYYDRYVPTANILIKHVDMNTGQILLQHQDTVAEGAYGPYGSQSFAGYRYVSLAPGSAPPSGSIGAGQSITIEFQYVGTATIQINYIENGSGNPVAAPETHTVDAGSYGPYDPPTVPGYIYSFSYGDPPFGTIAAGETKEITFYYDREREYGEVRIRFVDESYTELRPDEIRHMEVGTVCDFTYEIPYYQIEDYEFVEVRPSPVIYVMEGYNEVLFVYRGILSLGRSAGLSASAGSEFTLMPVRAEAKAAAPAAVGSSAGTRRVAVNIAGYGYNGAGLNLVNTGEGRYGFTLRGGEQLDLRGLPAGTRYRVSEVSLPAAEGTHTLDATAGGYPTASGDTAGAPYARYTSVYPGGQTPPPVVPPPVTPPPVTPPVNPPGVDPDPDPAPEEGGTAQIVPTPNHNGGGGTGGTGGTTAPPQEPSSPGNNFRDTLASILDGDVPLFGVSGEATWALLNLLLSLLGLLVAAVLGVRLLVTALRRRAARRQDEEENEAEWVDPNEVEAEQERRDRIWRRTLLGTLLAALAAVVSLVLFLVFQDTSLRVVWMDGWTIAHSLLLAGEVVFIALMLRRKKRDTGDDDGETRGGQGRLAGSPV